MRHYKPMSQAQRDARTDAKVARLEAAGIPARDALPALAAIRTHLGEQS